MCEKETDAIPAGARVQGRQQSTTCNTKLANDEDNCACNGPGGAFLEEVATKSFPEEAPENAVRELEASLKVDHAAGGPVGMVALTQEYRRAPALCTISGW